MKKTLFLLIFLAINCAQIEAQRQFAVNNPLWFVYTGTHKFAEKWSLHLEGQWRRNELGMKPLQALVRVGINHHFSGQATGTVGYGFFYTEPYGEFGAKSAFPEHRIWEQLQLKSQFGRVEWLNRLRVEQRFINLPVQKGTTFSPDDIATFSHRFRLLNRLSMPFKGKTIEDKSWYLTAFDEIFINAGESVVANLFDQNRAYLGIGYKMPKIGRLEFGYLQQLLVKSDGKRIENNHTIQFSLTSAIEFRKKK